MLEECGGGSLANLHLFHSRISQYIVESERNFWRRQTKFEEYLLLLLQCTAPTWRIKRWYLGTVKVLRDKKCLCEKGGVQSHLLLVLMLPANPMMSPFQIGPNSNSSGKGFG